MRSPRRAAAVWVVPVLVSVLSAVGSTAQSSPSYRIDTSTFSYGSSPVTGSASASYTMQLDSIGGGAASVGQTSAGYTLAGGFVSHYPPPREVESVRWNTLNSLVWDPDVSTGAYRVYRGSIVGLPGSGSSCLADGIEPASYSEGVTPASGNAFFYLVTSTNLLGEEGPMGLGSDGTVRTPVGSCP